MTDHKLEPLKLFKIDLSNIKSKNDAKSQQNTISEEVYNFFNQRNLTTDKITKYILTNYSTHDEIIKFIPFRFLYEMHHDGFNINKFPNETLVALLNQSMRKINCNAIENEIVILNNKFSNEFNFLPHIINKRLQQSKLFSIFNMIDLNDYYIGFDILKHFICNQLFLKQDKIIGKLYCKNKSVKIIKSKNINIHYHQNTKDILISSDGNFVQIQNQYYSSYTDIFVGNSNELIYDISENKFYVTMQMFANLQTNINTQAQINIKDDYQTFNYDIYRTKIKSTKIHANINKKCYHCYQCKKNVDYVLYNYTGMCGQCAIFNNDKKLETADLSKYTIFISGIRNKIGFAAGLKLLRCGARVYGSTRWSHVALMNFVKQHDYANFKDRLHIIKCDFTNINQVNQLIDILKEQKIHAIINNACRTVESSEEYIAKINDIENILQLPNIINSTQTVSNINGETRIITPIQVINASSVNIVETRLVDKINGLELNDEYYNKFYEIKEVHRQTSWHKSVDELLPKEIIHVTLINQIVPILLINSILPTMTEPRFVINVTAVEGQFVSYKNKLHAHTNMCKSAINMLSRTLAMDSNIKSYCIDPGFVSGVGTNFTDYPLSIEDGGSRIIDPIIQWANNNPLPQKWIKLRNYVVSTW